jgi:hypothetical protein
MCQNISVSLSYSVDTHVHVLVDEVLNLIIYSRTLWYCGNMYWRYRHSSKVCQHFTKIKKGL